MMSDAFRIIFIRAIIEFGTSRSRSIQIVGSNLVTRMVSSNSPLRILRLGDSCALTIYRDGGE